MYILVVRKIKPGDIVYFSEGLKEPHLKRHEVFEYFGIPYSIDLNKFYTVKETRNAIADHYAAISETTDPITEVIQAVVLEEVPELTFRSSLFKLEKAVIHVSTVERIVEYAAGIFANIYSEGTAIKKFEKKEFVKTA